MKIKIKSYNSKDFRQTRYISVDPKSCECRKFLDSAMEIQFLLQLDEAEIGVYWSKQWTKARINDCGMSVNPKNLWLFHAPRWSGAMTFLPPQPQQLKFNPL